MALKAKSRISGPPPPPNQNNAFLQATGTSDVFPQSSVCLTDTFLGTGDCDASFTSFCVLMSFCDRFDLAVAIQACASPESGRVWPSPLRRFLPDPAFGFSSISSLPGPPPGKPGPMCSCLWWNKAPVQDKVCRAQKHVCRGLPAEPGGPVHWGQMLWTLQEPASSSPFQGLLPPASCPHSQLESPMLCLLPSAMPTLLGKSCRPCEPQLWELIIHDS